MDEEKPELIPIKGQVEDVLNIYMTEIGKYINKELQSIQKDTENLVNVLKNQVAGRKPRD